MIRVNDDDNGRQKLFPLEKYVLGQSTEIMNYVINERLLIGHSPAVLDMVFIIVSAQLI